jgi:hypothetical protein
VFEQVEDTGSIRSGKRFVLMYSLSFFCCKLATVFFVLLGHIPALSDCNSTAVNFVGGEDAVMTKQINCTVCFPPSSSQNITQDARCDNRSHIYHACTTDCATIFFSGAGMKSKQPPISLDVFVLVPLLWLPFAVYSNNEVARMIDGIWHRTRQDNRQAPSLHQAARVGLSTTAHGYQAVANLAHAVFLLCAVALLSFLITARGGYHVYAPTNLEQLQGNLDRAGHFVTGSVIIIDMLMLCRLLYEQCSCGGASTPTPRADPRLWDGIDGPLHAPLMPPPRPRQPSRFELCMYGCGRRPGPGCRPNGVPFDTCCRACAKAEGQLQPSDHDVECVARERERRMGAE